MTPESFIFRCAHCNRSVSCTLTCLDDLSTLKNEDGAEFLPRGAFLRQQDNPHDDAFYSARSGDFLVRLEDLENLVPGGKRIGCCGCDGTDGPNWICLCGQAIATEHSDCWMPHFVVLHGKDVRLESVSLKNESTRS